MTLYNSRLHTLSFSPYIDEMKYSDKIKEILKKTEEIIMDKEESIKLCLTGLLAQGHILIEDRPGVGKTSLLKTMAHLLGLSNQRIQFTNDLLPSDIIGTPIFNQQTQEFQFHKGPLFAHFVLADEINRASPKTQSACLQAMEERSVTVDRVSHELPKPFFLVATQNPQENVGTFRLPDSQLDRFLFRIHLGLPSPKAERDIITGRDRHLWIEELEPITNAEEISQMHHEVANVHVSESALDYLQAIIEKSREVSEGVSTRGAKQFYNAAKSYAYVSGRDYVIPEDFQSVGLAVLSHRLWGGSSATGLEKAQDVLNGVPVP